MDISNKTLALFLLGAIVVSLGGTILSLNKLGDVSSTGLVTGDVNLEIASSLSITTADRSTIDFGTCTPVGGQTLTINSEDGANTSATCDGDISLGGIFVRNNGNVNANVTIQSNVVGAAQSGTFLNSSVGNSSLQYRTVENGLLGNTNGCQGGLVASYTAFAANGTEYLVCSNLTFGSTENSFETHIQIIIPPDAPVGVAAAVLTFTAEQVS
jgi:hypothetical protein